MFHTRFWEDSYVADLDPIEKLLFIYTITSPRVSLCGIYEVPIRYIATETGIDKDMIIKIFDRLGKSNKVIYKDGWVCVPKYPKYQSYNLPAVKRGLENEIKSVPPPLLSFFIERGFEFSLIKKSLPIDCQYIGNKGKDRDKEQVKVKDKEERNVPKKEKYGEFQNVLLTPNEYMKLVDQYGKEPAEVLVEELSGYIESTGKRYKSHYATLLNWARRKVNEHVKEFKKNNKVAFI